MYLKLRDIITGINLDEGLIKTYPIDTSIYILNRDKDFNGIFKASKFQSWLVVEFQRKDIEWTTMEAAHLFEDMVGVKEGEFSLNYVLDKLNSFGYIPAFYRTFYNGTQISQSKFVYNTLRAAISTAKGTEFQILFQAKYSETLARGDVPATLYHASDSKNDNRILKIGLIPRKSERYDERIYVVCSAENITDSLIENLKREKNCKKMTIFKIDTTGLGLVLFKDVEFKDRGFYIKKNVSPKNLELLRTV
jgi:hypothetical protein